MISSKERNGILLGTEMSYNRWYTQFANLAPVKPKPETKLIQYMKKGVLVVVLCRV